MRAAIQGLVEGHLRSIQVGVVAQGYGTLIGLGTAGGHRAAVDLGAAADVDIVERLRAANGILEVDVSVDVQGPVVSRCAVDGAVVG